ncbi:MAG: hypothetical protein WC010_03615 [Candidatus Absconditabacterales bacterium]
MIKKTFFLMILVAVMASSIFATNNDTIKYMIVYGQGIDTLIQQAGDKIGSDVLAFYENEDQFFRGDPMSNGIIECSSYGHKFWLQNVRMEEDTLVGFVKILSAIVVDDPNVLITAVIQPTAGDANPPVDLELPLTYVLLIGLLIIFAIISCFWLFLKKKKQSKSEQ